jgi:hypothetical protein
MPFLSEFGVALINNRISIPLREAKVASMSLRDMREIKGNISDAYDGRDYLGEYLSACFAPWINHYFKGIDPLGFETDLITSTKYGMQAYQIYGEADAGKFADYRDYFYEGAAIKDARLIMKMDKVIYAMEKRDWNNMKEFLEAFEQELNSQFGIPPRGY